MENNVVIYQSPNGEIVFRGDPGQDTLWANQEQIAHLFGVDRTVITKHIRNIFSDQELHAEEVRAKFAHTTDHGAIKGKTQTKDVMYYNLDIILAVGYRTQSSVAIKFRQWATRTLRQHVMKGYTLNRKRLAQNYEEFLSAIESVKSLLPASGYVQAEDALELVKMFAGTWFSLDAYDKAALPLTGASKKHVDVQAEELSRALGALRRELMDKGEASELFGQEKHGDAVAGIVGNVFQSVFGEDAYPSVEEKAAHLLYFFVKNHPFTDGNKRSGAFAFIWFLRKAEMLQRDKISPEVLTVLTILVAESPPREKDKVIGLIVQLLG